MTDWYMAMLVFLEGIVGVFVVLITLQLSINIFKKIVNLLPQKKAKGEE